MNIENNNNITVISGDSTSVPFGCYRDASTPIDLTNAVIKFTVRDGNKNIILYKDSTGGGITKLDQGILPGKFHVNLKQRDTFNLDGTFDFDVQFDFINIDNRVARVTGIIGKFNIVRDITDAK